MLIRFTDWPERYAAFLAARQTTPFKWGDIDCAFFVCDAVLAMTGVDLAADFRGRYNSPLSAARAIRKSNGVFDLELLAERIAEQHSIVAIPIAFAQRGDVVLVGTRSMRLGFALVDLSGHELVVPDDGGLRRAPLTLARKAWRI